MKTGSLSGVRGLTCEWKVPRDTYVEPLNIWGCGSVPVERLGFVDLWFGCWLKEDNCPILPDKGARGRFCKNNQYLEEGKRIPLIIYKSGWCDLAHRIGSTGYNLDPR